MPTQACGVSAAVAAERAEQVARQHSLFERPLGVLGRWGGITRAWLDEVLPPEAVDLCRDRVRLVVTQVALQQIAHISPSTVMPGPRDSSFSVCLACKV